MNSLINATQSERSAVLTKALLSLVDFYHLSGKDLAEIIGISEASVTRLYQGKKSISPDTKEGELCLLLLRLYRSLNAMVGNNHTKARQWLQSPNRYFGKPPFEAIKTVTGLVETVNYLDAMRGKI
ncbi:antitoxin Xre/MbcA/ParS toxin-binding domain-containing protein [Legionella sp. CNM-4043-24]|uniref:antitoxin Xre/MbcA/ParS toxin-binding domain-containing protein n=1 Tax=Legionella sp. CNM-4043-24 TaxID=3421646 RepID=UPI00403AD93F